MWNGFLNLNKPTGMTAHDCVSRLRKILHQKRIGHSGTLDPAAVGVLPIAVGHSTRLIRFLSGGKTYKATVRFGQKTTTDDLDGEIVKSQACASLELVEIESLIPLFLGTIQQIPPAFSAIQVQGVRLYELARSGKAVDVPIRTVEVKDIQILEWRPGDFPELDLTISCGTGTYIRAIARDLGDRLGCGATLACLERTYSNGFDLSSSLTFAAIAAKLQQDCLVLMPPEVALSYLPQVSLEMDLAKRWCNGQAIAMEMPKVAESANYLRVCDRFGTFLGIAELQDQKLAPVVVLPSEILLPGQQGL
jgi:tRNA pseudouridine55 synthase